MSKSPVLSSQRVLPRAESGRVDLVVDVIDLIMDILALPRGGIFQENTMGIHDATVWTVFFGVLAHSRVIRALRADVVVRSHFPILTRVSFFPQLAVWMF